MSSQGDLYRILPWNYITSFEEGVVVQKDGILQRTFAYRPPDLASAAAHDFLNLSRMFNNTIKRMGRGRAVFFEVQRFSTQDYPEGQFKALAARLVDEERSAAFRESGSHYESSYYITFVYKPETEALKKLTSFFIKSNDGGGNAYLSQDVKQFVDESNAVVEILASCVQIAPLSNEETVAYLHSQISFRKHGILFPQNAIFLDKILPDEDLTTDLTMRLGERYIPIIGVNDFPMETYPAVFEELNQAELEYRWVTRYICTDKEAGTKEAAKLEKAHRGNQTSLPQSFIASTTGEQPKQLNRGSLVREEDAAQAGIEIDTDRASLGYYSSNVMVWDKTFKGAKKRADLVRQIINSKGFTCKEETFNALRAFQSMMAGQVFANYRALPVLTNTLSHIIPLSSIWAGGEYNAHAEKVSGCSAPHVICNTAGGTPFYLNLNVGDVGHTLIFGPTGAGKSTLLNLLEMQFFKYPRGQVIVFDKGRSCRQPCMACGGLYYEPASDNTSAVNFQPLHDLEKSRDTTFAVEFIEALLTLQNVTVVPAMSKAVMDAVNLMKDVPYERRTLTTFSQMVNYTDPDTRRNVIQENITPYLWSGAYGKIFDNDASKLSLNTRYLAIEMEHLMNLGEKAVIPALIYLFYFVEKMFSESKLTMLVLDEAWLFLKNPLFANKIAEWLKTLRKLNVYVVFATQDVADAAASPIRSTLLQQCLTKIYLADPQAGTAGMYDAYASFGLSDSEIGCISAARMKHDYFYKSPLGTRQFQLELGKVTLGLIAGQNHAMLDELRERHKEKADYVYCKEILDAKGINY